MNFCILSMGFILNSHVQLIVGLRPWPRFLNIRSWYLSVWPISCKSQSTTTEYPRRVDKLFLKRPLKCPLSWLSISTIYINSFYAIDLRQADATLLKSIEWPVSGMLIGSGTWQRTGLYPLNTLGSVSLHLFPLYVLGIRHYPERKNNIHFSDSDFIASVRFLCDMPANT